MVRTTRLNYFGVLLAATVASLGQCQDATYRSNALQPSVAVRLSTPVDPEADRLAQVALRKLQNIETLPEFLLEYKHSQPNDRYVKKSVSGVSVAQLVDVFEGEYELMNPMNTKYFSRRLPADSQSGRELGFYRKSLLFDEQPPYEKEEKRFWDGTELWMTSLTYEPDESERTQRLWRHNDPESLRRVEKGWCMSQITMPMAGGTRKIQNSVRANIFAAQSRYKRVGEIVLGGRRCAILDAADLDLRLYVDLKTERLAGRLNLLWQGRINAPYWRVSHDRLGVEPFDSVDEFLEWVQSLPYKHQVLVGRDFGSYMNNDSGVQINLGELACYSDYVSLGHGVELPRKLEYAYAIKLDRNVESYNYQYSVVTMTDFRTSVDDEEFVALQPENGYDTYDDRFGILIRYQYKKEMPEAELKELVNEARRKRLETDEWFREASDRFDAMLGKPSPKFDDHRWLDAKAPSLSGKPYLIHFWATWCGPCKQELPRLSSISKRVNVIGVHPSGTEKMLVKKVANTHQIEYPIYLSPDDPKGLVAGYPAQVFPYTVLVDEDGQVAAHGSLDFILERVSER